MPSFEQRRCVLRATHCVSNQTLLYCWQWEAFIADSNDATCGIHCRHCRHEWCSRVLMCWHVWCGRVGSFCQAETASDRARWRHTQGHWAADRVLHSGARQHGMRRCTVRINRAQSLLTLPVTHTSPTFWCKDIEWGCLWFNQYQIGIGCCVSRRHGR